MTRPASSAWRRVRIALAAIGAVVVVTIATQAVWLAPLLSHQITQRAGREVHVDSMWIGLSSTLAPVVHFRGIRIANAPWADSSKPFAVLGSARAVFSWQSIEQRRPVIALWSLADGEIDLERTAEGLRNWRLTNPEDRGPGRWKVLAVQGDRATVRFAHGGLDLDLRVTASAASAASSAAAASAASRASARPTHLEMTGRWRELPFTISADTGPVVTFLETGATFPVRGRIESGGARLDLDGSAGDIVRRPIVDASVTIAVPSLAPFSAFVASRHREAKAIRVEGALTIGEDRHALSGMKLRIGASDVSGDLSWSRGEDRHVVRATLTSESTDVADLRWLSGLAPVRAASSPARTESSPARAASAPASAASGVDEPRAARALDAELAFVARRLRAAEVPAVQSGRVEAKLLDGQLTISRFDLGVAQGHVEGHGSLALHAAPMRGEAEVNVRGVRVESFVRDAEGKSRLTGALGGHATLKAQGDSAAGLRDSVSGRVTASLTGGTISSLLDAEIGLQGGKIVRSLLGGAEPVAIRCATATLDLDRGTGRVRTLVFDTERTRTTGGGTIDLGAETLDIVLTPEAKQGGLFNLERSIRVHGPLRHPARALVARAPVAAAPDRGCGRS